MNSLKKIKRFLNVTAVKHTMFWLLVYIYFIGTASIDNYTSTRDLLSHYFIYVLCQILVAYTCLQILIPRLLIPKKHIQFSISLFILMTFVFMIFVGYHEYYHIPKFVDINKDVPYDSQAMFLKRIINFRIFIGKSTIILTPTVLLVFVKFYKDQQAYLILKEQKTSTELAVLKHQLNPHFLFNTLNNLYALSVEKSDEAPEVIAKLSEILDYILYGCNDKFVPLYKEIELIENYLALEKIRYDNRVDIHFSNNLTKPTNIAPLILLTFIENAFKHGVAQELNKAIIKIEIDNDKENILFKISNSIAQNNVSSGKNNIGLSNVKKQLELLYLNTFSLDINETDNNFSVVLKLPLK